jgi:hypothetical protein
MKRIVSVILLLLLLCSCASTPLEINVADAASLLHGGITFVDIMSDMDTAGICRIFALTDAEVAYAAGYVSTGATAEECTFLLFEKEEDALAATQRFQLRLEEQTMALTNYQPAELPKLEDAVHGYCAHKDGFLTYLVVAADPAAAQDAVDSLIP